VDATTRNLSRRQALDDARHAARVSVNALAVEVQDAASVDVALADVIDREGRIDVLADNAGSGFRSGNPTCQSRRHRLDHGRQLHGRRACVPGHRSGIRRVDRCVPERCVCAPVVDLAARASVCDVVDVWCSGASTADSVEER
jgi:NAD(P)-dependent dehydrogenase (short-subunit alcohol dehydrogenase family)